MPDPAEPIPPPPAPAIETGPGSESSSTDLPPNLAAAIACIPLVGGVIFYILEKRNSFVRFYAMQSIIFGFAWLLFNIASGIVHLIFGTIPALGGLLVFLWSLAAGLVQLAFLVIWIVSTVKAFMSVRWEIPYIGPMARKQVEGS
jgi:uncharacterized membrane protein